VSGGVGEHGLGNSVSLLRGVAAWEQAKGTADVLPGEPGFAGGADVLGGVLAGGEF